MPRESIRSTTYVNGLVEIPRCHSTQFDIDSAGISIVDRSYAFYSRSQAPAHQPFNSDSFVFVIWCVQYSPPLIPTQTQMSVSVL